MKNQCTRKIVVIAALVSILIAGAVSADEINFCKKDCAADLKECRKQADTTANYEAHPIISGSSRRAVDENGQMTRLVANDERADSQDEEIQQRKMDRYQECEADNDICQRQCSLEPLSRNNFPKN